MEKFRHAEESVQVRFNRAALIISLIYFAAYFAYLYFFTELETELAHWLTLVVLPLLLLALVQRLSTESFSIESLLAAVGIQRGKLSHGLGVAIAVGLVLGSLQLLLSRKSAEALEIVTSFQVIYKLPLAFALMLLTAGLTEEFYFRGVLQTALLRVQKRKLWSVIISATAFGLYHFPYAYKLESWPSHGDPGQALTEGVAFSAVIGLILAGLHVRYRNLLVPVIVHSLFNAVWAMTMLK